MKRSIILTDGKEVDLRSAYDNFKKPITRVFNKGTYELIAELNLNLYDVEKPNFNFDNLKKEVETELAWTNN